MPAWGEARGEQTSPTERGNVAAPAGGEGPLLSAMADLCSGQERLTGRVNGIQTQLDGQGANIQRLLAAREADAAREAVIGREAAGALSDWLSAELPARGRSQAMPGDKRNSLAAAMDTSSSGGSGRSGRQRSLSNDRAGGAEGGLSDSRAEGPTLTGPA